MKNLSAEQQKAIAFALAKFNEAAQELAAALEQSGYKLETAPEYLEDVEDFAYDILTMTEDELEALEEVTVSAEGKELINA
jgi:hypothetical protein